MLLGQIEVDFVKLGLFGWGAFFFLALWGAGVLFTEWRFRDRYPEGSIALAAMAIVLLVFRGGSMMNKKSP